METVYRALLLILLAIISAPPAQAQSRKEENLCYVACQDKRIYVIDISRKKVLDVSDPIPELGNPTCIDVSGDGKTLYIGSERGYMESSYCPIVVVDLNTMKVKRKFYLEIEEPSGYISAVYNIRVSPDGSKLFVGYANPKYRGGSVVIDADKGEILKHLKGFYVDQNSSFSKDGRYVCNIRPDEIIVYDVQSGRKLKRSLEYLLRLGQGLNPPWRQFKAPLCVIEKQKDRYILKAVNRLNGKLLWEKEIEKETGLLVSDRY